MKKYRAGSIRQAAAIARRSTGWNDEERETLKDIAESRLFGTGHSGSSVFWDRPLGVGFWFLGIGEFYEVRRIYTQ